MLRLEWLNGTAQRLSGSLNQSSRLSEPRRGVTVYTTARLGKYYPCWTLSTHHHLRYDLHAADYPRREARWTHWDNSFIVSLHRTKSNTGILPRRMPWNLNSPLLDSRGAGLVGGIRSRRRSAFIPRLSVVNPRALSTLLYLSTLTLLRPPPRGRSPVETHNGGHTDVAPCAGQGAAVPREPRRGNGTDIRRYA